jgi:hypothetical protein
MDPASLNGAMLPILPEAVLDYERLVARYQYDLFHSLRGHCSLDYLEIWVPDEDPVKGLLNMFEAAQSCGRDQLIVNVGATTESQIDTQQLLGLLGNLGKATLERADDGVRVLVSGMRAASVLPAAYRDALDARAANIRHRGLLSSEFDTGVVSATNGDVTLSARLDVYGVVVEARHHGAVGDECGALDELCTIMLQRPLREAADHGLIRLEYTLRNRSLSPPVPGIINAERVNSGFRRLTRLVRDLNAKYVEMLGERVEQSAFTDIPQAAWLALSPNLQSEAASRVLRRVLLESHARADDARVFGLEQGERVMIVFHESVSAMDKAQIALHFEVALQTECEPTLQVFLADLRDENAARRL